MCRPIKYLPDDLDQNCTYDLFHYSIVLHPSLSKVHMLAIMLLLECTLSFSIIYNNTLFLYYTVFVVVVMATVVPHTPILGGYHASFLFND